MLLIGQYDSPFVRRVGVALQHYGLPFEHRGHAVFRDAEKIAEHNPLRRVPTLVLDDGTVLTESGVCLEILDGRVAASRGDDCSELLLPRRGPLREQGLRICGFIGSALDKAVSLIYERRVRSVSDPAWVERSTLQLRETLEMLDAECAVREGPYYLGTRFSHADIFLSCGLTLVDEALPEFLAKQDLPHLRALAARASEQGCFDGIYLPFVVHT